MSRIKSMNDYYKVNFNWIPDHIQKEIGRFNVFRLDDFVRKHYKPVPFGRKDYYKISLIIGKNKVYYSDKVFEVKKHALLFSNPQVPYNWENTDSEQSGYVCVFSADFFYQFGNLKNYTVFQPGFLPVLELTTKQVEKVKQVFEQMIIDLNSTYIHKYDALRNRVFEIVHFILKTQPAFNATEQKTTTSYKKAVLFLELLEHQF
ncbi:MAG: AraC family transcriptional regulator, partial [Niastella sp.]|uniref:AraC family transcriptional regulator n=1 Tax=Niastella sp. TaxID=1869183 RepID=UPI00389A37F2